MTHKNKTRTSRKASVGTTVFITGGATGIGKATTDILLANGWHVAVYTNTIPTNAETKAWLKNPLLAVYKGNICNATSVKSALQKAIKKFGPISVLINNAAIAESKEFIHTSKKDWDTIIDVNIKGTLTVTKETLSFMKKQESGLIVNIASGAGLFGIKDLSIYSLTKAALINFSQSLAQEIKKDGIRVITITPGSTHTSMFHTCFPGQKPFHTPQQVAAVIVRAIEGNIRPNKQLVVDTFKHAMR